MSGVFLKIFLILACNITLFNFIQIKNKQTGRFLDANDARYVFAISVVPNGYQKWSVEESNNGISSSHIRLKYLITDEYLDSNRDGKVYTRPENNGTYQDWHLSESNNFINVETGLCLDAIDFGYVYTLKCNGGKNQKWIMN